MPTTTRSRLASVEAALTGLLGPRGRSGGCDGLGADKPCALPPLLVLTPSADSLASARLPHPFFLVLWVCNFRSFMVSMGSRVVWKTRYLNRTAQLHSGSSWEVSLGPAWSREACGRHLGVGPVVCSRRAQGHLGGASVFPTHLQVQVLSLPRAKSQGVPSAGRRGHRDRVPGP